MTNFHYPLPESEPSSPWSGLSDEARTALSRVAVGPSVANQLLQPHGLVNPEISLDFQSVVSEARQNYGNTLINTGTGISIPEITSSEFSEVDWQRLELGYKAYELLLGMSPELVITPEGQPISFWKSLYGNLREWQGINNPDSPHRLKKQDDGDGLYIDNQVADHWDQLTPDRLSWGVTVVPTISDTPSLNVDYEGKDENGDISTELTHVLAGLGHTGLYHPSVERYLMLQATRLQSGQEPVDSKTYTWLNGNFTNSENNQVAPRGRWFPGSGQVYLAWRKVGIRGDNLGVRPEVRGQDL